MKYVGIIPARFASSRFPGKPLTVIEGKTMIHRVYEQASKSKILSEVIVATDDERIVKEVNRFGGQVMMTSSAHKSGTDRCAELIEKEHSWDVVLNIQGDEPYIQPEQIDLLCNCFQSTAVQIATLIKQINSTEELFNVNTPKVIFNSNKEALYFSRTPIPYCRDQEKDHWLKSHTYYKHIGIYAYRSDVLKAISRLKPSSLELAESLEQLRWLENGYKVHVEITQLESIAIDSPEDLIKLFSAKK